MKSQKVSSLVNNKTNELHNDFLFQKLQGKDMSANQKQKIYFLLSLFSVKTEAKFRYFAMEGNV